MFWCSTEWISCSVEIVGATPHVFIRMVTDSLYPTAAAGQYPRNSRHLVTRNIPFWPSLQDLSLCLSLLYPTKAITIPALLGPLSLLAVGLLVLDGFILEVTPWI